MNFRRFPWNDVCFGTCGFHMLPLGLLSSWASGRGDLEALASGMYIKWNDITRDRCPQDVVEICYSLWLYKYSYIYIHTYIYIYTFIPVYWFIEVVLTAIVEDFAGKLNIDRACCPEKFRGNLHLVATSPCALGKVADFQNSGRLGVGFLGFVFLSVGKKTCWIWVVS